VHSDVTVVLSLRSRQKFLLIRRDYNRLEFNLPSKISLGTLRMFYGFTLFDGQQSEKNSTLTDSAVDDITSDFTHEIM
jgi:hypothetical protein